MPTSTDRPAVSELLAEQARVSNARFREAVERQDYAAPFGMLVGFALSLGSTEYPNEYAIERLRELGAIYRELGAERRDTAERAS